MRRKKRLQELTIKDNFMFGAVMADEEMCRELLEIVLGFSIEKVKVSKEHSLIYNPEYRGVRLDVYARDASHTRYNVEMQVSRDAGLPRRSRYYRSQIDMELLLSGVSYSELPDSYVIGAKIHWEWYAGWAGTCRTAVRVACVLQGPVSAYLDGRSPSAPWALVLRDTLRVYLDGRSLPAPWAYFLCILTWNDIGISC